jgi:hypothetical protein
MTINFKLSKETKGTYVYEEVSDNPIIPTVYIRKSAFKDKAPEALQMELKI